MLTIDHIDRAIIGHLVNDGRIAIRSLAQRVALSPSATSERVRKLEEGGLIEGYGARLDPVASGRPIQAIIDVALQTSGTFDIDDALLAIPELIDAFHLTGRFDYQIRIATAGIEGIEAVIRHLKEDVGVRETSTRVVLRAVAGMPRQPLPLAP